MNWEVILWTCITVGFLLCTGGIILAIMSARTVKKRKATLSTVHTTLKRGEKVMFAGGIYGTVVKVKEDIVDVEVSKGVIFSVSRYSVQNIE